MVVVMVVVKYVTTASGVLMLTLHLAGVRVALELWVHGEGLLVLG